MFLTIFLLIFVFHSFNFLHCLHEILNKSKCNATKILDERCLIECFGMAYFHADFIARFRNECRMSLYFRYDSTNSHSESFSLNSTSFFKGDFSPVTIDKIMWQSACIDEIDRDFLAQVFARDSSKPKRFWSLSITNSRCLSVLKSDQFRSISQLRFLDLSFNGLRDIDDRAFSGLVALESLKLNNNYLTRITDRMFADLRCLRSLELSRNLIATIEPLSFRFVRRLELLKFNRNKLIVVPQNAFGFLDNLHTLDLSFNELASLDVDSVGDRCRESIRNLYLQNNRLSTLSEKILDFGNLNPSHVDLILSDNSWACDSGIAWMKVWSEFIRPTSIRCSKPPKFKDLTLHDISIVALKQTQTKSPYIAPDHDISLKDEVIGVGVSIFCVILFLSLLFIGYRYYWCTRIKICKINKKKLKSMENDSDDNTQLYMITKEGDRIV